VALLVGDHLHAMLKSAQLAVSRDKLVCDVGRRVPGVGKRFQRFHCTAAAKA
jgi:hypothetical protein